MRILVDENIPGLTEDMLSSLGHEVKRVPLHIKDAAVARLAERSRAILITRDRDFLNFLPSKHFGIVVIRIHPPIAETITQAVRSLFFRQRERWLQGKIFVLNEDGFEIFR